MHLVYNKGSFLISEARVYNCPKQLLKQLIILQKMARFFFTLYAKINSKCVIELRVFLIKKQNNY